MKRVLLTSFLAFSAQSSLGALQAPLELFGKPEPGIKTVNGVTYAYCMEGWTGFAPEVCSHPQDAWNLGLTTPATFYVGKPVWNSLEVRMALRDHRRLACTYCREGVSNGPLKGKGKEKNVIPLGGSFVVKASELGMHESCDGPDLLNWCSSLSGPGWPYSTWDCKQACYDAWLGQTIRITCDWTGTSNFDGDPTCNEFLQ